MAKFPNKRKDIRSFQWLQQYLLDANRDKTKVGLFFALAKKLLCLDDTGDTVYTSETLPPGKRAFTKKDLGMILKALHTDKIAKQPMWTPLGYLRTRVMLFLTPTRNKIPSPFTEKNNYRLTLFKALEQIKAIHNPVKLDEYNALKKKFVDGQLYSGKVPIYLGDLVDLTADSDNDVELSDEDDDENKSTVLD